MARTKKATREELEAKIDALRPYELLAALRRDWAADAGRVQPSRSRLARLCRARYIEKLARTAEKRAPGTPALSVRTCRR